MVTLKTPKTLEQKIIDEYNRTPGGGAPVRVVCNVTRQIERTVYFNFGTKAEYWATLTKTGQVKHNSIRVDDPWN